MQQHENCIISKFHQIMQIKHELQNMQLFSLHVYALPVNDLLLPPALLTFANSLYPDQAENIWLDLDLNCVTLWWYSQNIKKS